VWNLADYTSYFDDVEVVRNTIEVMEVKRKKPDGIIISPGPGAPETRRDVGNSPEIVKLGFPVLGVCLGHQIIAHVFGGKVGKFKPVHGKESLITHDGKSIFKDVRNPFKAGRYHSLGILKMPKNFEITAISEDGIIMGIRHKEKFIEGVQFHPESILTGREGVKIIKNFVELCNDSLWEERFLSKSAESEI
jgi:anthranilate synthase component 2